MHGQYHLECFCFGSVWASSNWSLPFSILWSDWWRIEEGNSYFIQSIKWALRALSARPQVLNCKRKMNKIWLKSRMLSNDFSCRVCQNVVCYKCTKDKRNARYIREGSCLNAAPLTKSSWGHLWMNKKYSIHLADVNNQYAKKIEKKLVHNKKL